ncbi:MAG: peptidyl-prolyl cis-trans isomerase [Candidatus Aureabacteria bacterium]|nr:peptidyl-prolyl cis-trans isomerase [Candidatus Auribacterota bacterium]
MLSFFRRKMKLILWILVIVVIVTFIPWGVGVRLRARSGKSGPAGELFGRKVSASELDEACDATQTYHTLFQSRTNLTKPQIREQAWERLIMLGEARRTGMRVSDRELAHIIQTQFGKDGSFDPKVYENVLTFAGVTPSVYEKWTKETLMINHLQQLTRAGIWVPDTELERRYRDEETKYTIQYALFQSEDMLKSVTATEEELKNYYADHPGEFKVPAKVDARYLYIPCSVPTVKPTLTDAEITSHYEERIDEFSHGKRVKYRHILLKVEGKDREKAESAAKTLADSIIAQLRKGKDFAALAKKYSQDEKTKDKGGELGFFEASGMPKALSDKAFSMKKEEISDPIKTQRGYEIIQVEDFQEPGTKPMEEVKEAIRAKLEKEKQDHVIEEAKGAAYAKAVDISLALVDNPNLEELAKKSLVELKETGLFAENEPVKDIGPSKEFAKAAFSTEVGSFGDIVEIPNKAYCIILPKKKVDETMMQFEEAREIILKKIKEQKAKEKAHEVAVEKHTEAINQIKENKTDFAASCAALSIPLKESAAFTARGPIPELGQEQEIASAAVTLEPGAPSPVIDIKKGSCFFSVISRKEPTDQEITKNLETFRKRVQSREESTMLNEWNKWVHEQAKRVDYSVGTEDTEETIPEEGEE